MRIVWVVNLILPMMYGNDNSLKSSGGWMEALLRGLAETEGLELHVVAPAQKTVFHFSIIERIHFHTVKTNYISRVLFPGKQVKNSISTLFTSIKPDLVHIHGTEFPFMEDALDVAQESQIPVVTSIQGLISEICKREYHYAGILSGSVISSVFQYGPMIMGPIFLKRIISMIRARSEIRQIKKNKIVIGRTAWDKRHCLAINPNIEYRSVQEIIRQEFYSEEWDDSQAERGRIFCAGGCRSPIKGFHQILLAIAALKEKNKEKLTIIVPGISPFTGKAFGYKLYLKRLIERLGLQNDIVFLGSLSAKDMAQEFSKAELYVMGSSIENSSNTLAEALIVGTPSIVPNVGGIPSIARDGRYAVMYQFGNSPDLMTKIRELRADNERQKQMSKAGRETRLLQYNNKKTIIDYVTLYRTVISKT